MSNVEPSNSNPPANRLKAYRASALVVIIISIVPYIIAAGMWLFEPSLSYYIVPILGIMSLIYIPLILLNFLVLKAVKYYTSESRDVGSKFKPFGPNTLTFMYVINLLYIFSPLLVILRGFFW